jgi:hypothetical protein
MNDMGGPGLLWLLVLGIVAVGLVQLWSVWPSPRQETTQEKRECNRGAPAPDNAQESNAATTLSHGGAGSAPDDDSRHSEAAWQHRDIHAVC